MSRQNPSRPNPAGPTPSADCRGGLAESPQWLRVLVHIIGTDVERGVPFPDFEDYLHQEEGGWGPSGRCQMCEDRSLRLTDASGYCLACTKYMYGCDYGECAALAGLARRIAEGFTPIRLCLHAYNDNDRRD